VAVVKVRDNVTVKTAELPSVTCEGELETVTVGKVEVKAALIVWQEQTAARVAKAARIRRAKRRRLEIMVKTIITIEHNPCASPGRSRSARLWSVCPFPINIYRLTVWYSQLLERKAFQIKLCWPIENLARAASDV
jgi:hypothetical protein